MNYSIIQFHASVKEIIEFCIFIDNKYDTSFIFFDIHKSFFCAHDLVLYPFSGGRVFINSNRRDVEKLDFDGLENISLNIDIGAYFDGKIFESSIFFKKDLPEEDRELFGKILKEFRKITKPGVTALNIDTGATSFLKNNRYTDTIVELFKNGIQVIPFGGGKKIFLDFQ